MSNLDFLQELRTKYRELKEDRYDSFFPGKKVENFIGGLSEDCTIEGTIVIPRKYISKLKKET